MFDLFTFNGPSLPLLLLSWDQVSNFLKKGKTFSYDQSVKPLEDHLSKSSLWPLAKTMPLCDEHPPIILPLGQYKDLLFRNGSGSV